MSTYDAIIRLPLDEDRADLLRRHGQWLKAHCFCDDVADDDMSNFFADLTAAHRQERLTFFRLQLACEGKLDDLVDMIHEYDVRGDNAAIIETWTFSNRDTALMFKLRWGVA